MSKNMKLSEIFKILEDNGYDLHFHMTIEAYVPFRRRKRRPSKRKKELKK